MARARNASASTALTKSVKNRARRLIFVSLELCDMTLSEYLIRFALSCRTMLACTFPLRQGLTSNCAASTY
jgi:hypothetical protein